MKFCIDDEKVKYFNYINKIRVLFTYCCQEEIVLDGSGDKGEGFAFRSRALIAYRCQEEIVSDETGDKGEGFGPRVSKFQRLKRFRWREAPDPTPSFSQPLRLSSSKINQSLNFEHTHLQFSLKIVTAPPTKSVEANFVRETQTHQNRTFISAFNSPLSLQNPNQPKPIFRTLQIEKKFGFLSVTEFFREKGLLSVPLSFKEKRLRYIQPLHKESSPNRTVEKSVKEIRAPLPSASLSFSKLKDALATSLHAMRHGLKKLIFCANPIVIRSSHVLSPLVLTLVTGFGRLIMTWIQKKS
ncbi:hypothetical protein SO802_030503 [Lithocarpus litseifolius]|uniref:Uncharacterized protein n=1 Tax=Lithocarpus litseifolius TaxID=425828 RepID=A0AAW2BK74_9ROSI